jgi:prepilin-type N-terminal cleavage/methylation domain-containing protein/prepilin-type processing-associated H-X9-DG protein
LIGELRSKTSHTRRRGDITMYRTGTRPAARPRQRNRGFTLVEMLAVAAIITSLSTGQDFSRAKKTAYQTECKSNLKQVHQMLQMYVMENGHYPKAAFYPRDVDGPDSLKTVLEGVPDKMWVCPGLPDVFKQRGLSFIYNDALAGKSDSAVRNPAKKWVLIEFTCVSEQTPHAHPAGYNVLFADGHIITTKRLPKRITENYGKTAE